MPTWPAQLPAPALNTLNESPPDNTIRSQPDKGPALTRRRTTANVRPISFTMKVQPSLVDVLDDFYTTDTMSGSLEFTYTHPRTGDSVTARFAEKPVYTEGEGVMYNIAVKLEIMP